MVVNLETTRAQCPCMMFPRPYPQRRGRLGEARMLNVVQGGLLRDMQVCRRIYGGWYSSRMSGKDSDVSFGMSFCRTASYQ